jgi:hypothetical protein
MVVRGSGANVPENSRRPVQAFVSSTSAVIRSITAPLSGTRL